MGDVGRCRGDSGEIHGEMWPGDGVEEGKERARNQKAHLGRYSGDVGEM